MDSTDYFAHLHNEQQYLQKHGLESWPIDEDLARYVLDLEDKVESLYQYMKVVAVKDYRNRWIVRPRMEDLYG